MLTICGWCVHVAIFEASAARGLRNLAKYEQAGKDLTTKFNILHQHRHRIHYCEQRQRNLVVGNGHVEAVKKSTVTVRMKRFATRRGNSGGQAGLSIRSLVAVRPI